MNLIEAYQKAKTGSFIFLINSNNPIRFTKTGSFNIDIYELPISDEAWLSDSWQIERKPMVWEGEVIWKAHNEIKIYPISINNSDNQLHEFLLNIFQQEKHTKIRIEEIIEE